jgi:hypothetical protein
MQAFAIFMRNAAYGVLLTSVNVVPTIWFAGFIRLGKSLLSDGPGGRSHIEDITRVLAALTAPVREFITRLLTKPLQKIIRRELAEIVHETSAAT